MQDNTNNSYSLRDFLTILFSHKLAIILLFSSTLLTIIAGAYVWPETYEAKSSILIKLGRENVSIPTVAPSSQQQVITTGLRKEDINSEIELIRNQFIIEKVVRTLGVDFLYPAGEPPKSFFKRLKYELKEIILKFKDFIFEILYAIDFIKKISPFESAVLGIQKKLYVEQIKDSDVIEVKLRWFHPEIAKVIIDTLINFYQEHHLEIHETSKAYEFLQKQVEIIDKKLQVSEDKLQNLKTTQGISSYDEQIRFLLEQLTSFNASLKDTKTEIAKTKNNIYELEDQLAHQTENIELNQQMSRNPIIEPLKKELLKLELEKKKLLAKYSENSRPIDAIDKEIKAVKDKWEEEKKDIVESTTTGINTIYKETEKNLLYQYVQLEGLRASKIMLEDHINSYKKDLETLTQHESELKRLTRQFEIDEANYRLYKNKLEEVRISNVLDAERIVNVKVIDPSAASSKPVRPKKSFVIGIGFLFSIFNGIGFAFLSEYLDHSIKKAEDVIQYLNLPVLASIKESKEINEEEFEILKNNILLLKTPNPLKTILISSPVGKEGSSTVANNLIKTLAKNKKLRVIYSDLSLNPYTEIKETENENPGNEFDYLIYDSLPINSSSTVNMLASKVDGVIMVIHAGKTRWEVAKKAKEQLEMGHANIIGVVLNRKRHVIPGFIYNLI